MVEWGSCRSCYLNTDQIVNPVALVTGDASLAGDYGLCESPHEARVKLGLMLGLMPSLSRRRVDQINISNPANTPRLFFVPWIRSWPRTKTSRWQILLEPDPGGAKRALVETRYFCPLAVDPNLIPSKMADD